MNKNICRASSRMSDVPPSCIAPQLANLATKSTMQSGRRCVKRRELVMVDDGQRYRARIYDERSASCQGINESMTPLMTAASRSQFGLIEHLLATGRTDAADDATLVGDTALHLLIRSSTELLPCSPASERQIEQIVDVLTSSAGGSLHGAINALNDDGHSALFLASARGLRNVCRLLIDRGADPNVGLASDVLPLTAVCRYNEPEMIELLLSAGADPNGVALATGWPMENVSRRGLQLRNTRYIPVVRTATPISLVLRRHCSQRELMPILTLLIKHGADVNRPDDVGFSPLHRAVEFAAFELNNWSCDERSSEFSDDSESDVDEELGELDERVDLGVSSPDDDEGNRSSCRHVIDVLMDAGADANARSDTGTPTVLQHLLSCCRQFNDSYDYHLEEQLYRATELLGIFSALVERHDGLGAHLPNDGQDEGVPLPSLLLYLCSSAVDLMLHLLAAGVGLGMLYDFHDAIRERTPLYPLPFSVAPAARAPVSVELCKAVVVLNGYRASEDDIQDIQLLANQETVSGDAKTLQEFVDWLDDRRRNKPTQLQQLCRSVIRKRLAAANGNLCMGLLVDKLFPQCSRLNTYMMSVDETAII